MESRIIDEDGYLDDSETYERSCVAPGCCGGEGCPEMLLLDHDLGGDDTVKEFLKWLQEFIGYDAKAKHIVENLDYRVHSENGPGKLWIQSFMESWKKSFQE